MNAVQVLTIIDSGTCLNDVGRERYANLVGINMVLTLSGSTTYIVGSKQLLSCLRCDVDKLQIVNSRCERPERKERILVKLLKLPDD